MDLTITVPTKEAALIEDKFRTDPNNSPRAIGGVDRYVIVDGDCPVIERRSSGSSVWMSYKSESRAVQGLRRAQRELPSAEVFDKES